MPQIPSVEKLIEIFRRFPTVGSRTAGRFVYYLMKLPKERTDEIINAILELKNKIKLCQQCFQPFENSPVDRTTGLCAICLDSRRNKNLLCIVEKETDLLSLENTKKYNGLYFILGGTVSTMRPEETSQLRINELKKKLSQNNFLEIIIALNPTPEGRTTSVLVEQAIKEIVPSPTFKITHLARGIPVGGELEYADEETLQSALEGRK
ncbi:MAG: recombination mediator RecR [Candidatus Staskawiczbacteria bacterium]|jgi:recombination protein RecR